MLTIASIFRFSVIAVLGATLWSQTPAAKPAVGTVQAADAASRTLTIKTDDGTEIKVKVADGARVSQIPAGETSLQKATPAELSAVGVGDRVIARGPTVDGTLNATLVVLMSKTDIAKKQQQEQMLWATKGVSGMVTAVDKATNTVTINHRGTDGVKPMKITIAEKANVKRYAEGSVKYSEAIVSSIADIDVSDQVRALGMKSEDGLGYKADQVISGAFRNIAATVKSIDLTNGVIEVIDLDTKKPLFVKVGKDASLKKLPLNVATMMAMSMNGGTGGGGGGGARLAVRRLEWQRGRSLLPVLVVLVILLLRQGGLVVLAALADGLVVLVALMDGLLLPYPVQLVELRQLVEKLVLVARRGVVLEWAA